jgi:membrane-bound lytic murein transglycosylase D
MPHSALPLRITLAGPQPVRALLLSLLALSVLSACVPAGGAPRSPRTGPEPERLPPRGGLLGNEVRPVNQRLLGSVGYDLPVVANNWVEAELNFLVGQRRDVIGRWLERGDYYQAFVESVFREAGIPTDLHHLGMIESGFLPTARSRAGAVGMWQFMPATSRDVNLRVDSIVDERMDPVRSTRAAARHLRHLYRVHGDWELAAAAYNAGSTRITRSLQRHAATNFWDLAQRGDLALETREYVPRLFAMTIIGRDRQRFGFAPPIRAGGFAFDSVRVDSSTPLAELAGATAVPLERLRQMNPHLLNGVTPAGSYWVWVPAGSAPAGRLAPLPVPPPSQEGVAEYTVRWGDTLGRLAQLSGVASARIRELNPGVDFERLQAGAVIRLPEAAAASLANRAEGEPVQARPTAPPATAAAPPRPAAAATPEPREPSTSEAQRAAAALLREAASTPDPSRPAEPATRSAGAATPARAAATASPGPTPGRGANVHEVRPGETLSQIARTHGVSVTAIRQANGITGDVIRPGQRLTLPGAGPPTPAVVEHVVVTGETLSGIARQHGVSVSAIRDANGLSGDVIRPGQRLSIPGTGAAAPRSVEHVVVAGETLSGIARRYGVSVSGIREANGLRGDVIRPGQRLTVPL